MRRLALLVVAIAASGAARADYFLACNSGGYAYTYCPADTRAGVELEERTSEAPCTINDSWGYDAGGVWVDKGCRARFHILAAGSSPAPAEPVGQANGLVPDEVLQPLIDDDAEHRREPGYGTADAVIACAEAAASRERGHGGSATVVEVQQVIARGRRAFDVRFTLTIAREGEEHDVPARCTVQNGAVTDYNHF